MSNDGLSLAPSLAHPDQLPGAITRERHVRKKRHYTELERLSALISTAAVGVADTSRALAIPQATLRQWLLDIGGISGLGKAVQQGVGITHYALALRVADTLARKLDDMTVDQLLLALKMLGMGAVQSGATPAHLATDAPPPAQVLVMVGDSRIPLVVDTDNPPTPTSLVKQSGEPKQLPASTD